MYERPSIIHFAQKLHLPIKPSTERIDSTREKGRDLGEIFN